MICSIRRRSISRSKISPSLARVARWNGQTSGSTIFSVAQHSLLVEACARTADPGLDNTDLLAALLHDAPEYVIGDMISPFKAVIGSNYKEVEHRLLAAIHIRFGLAPILLAGFTESEANKFFGGQRLDPSLIGDFMDSWSADQAKQRFVDRFEILSSRR
ncbi:MAG: hypothetical protein RL543_1205 [Pseudomonadota bacterium]